MALGTYDREERKKLKYNANGTTSEEKDDRSAQGNVLQTEPATAPMKPTQVAPAPQVQNVGTVNVQPQLDPLERKPKLAAATPPQNNVTNQGLQSNVISGGDIKNSQGEVNDGTPAQETGTSQESQVGPDSSAGAENMQWAGAPQGGIASTYNDLIGPQNATPPQVPVKNYNGLDFSTVTSTGKALTGADMDAYYDMLKKRSEATGESIEYLDKLAGNLLVGKAPSSEQGTVAENGNNTTDNGAANTGGASASEPKETASSPVTSETYDSYPDSVLKGMIDAERDPLKKALIERSLARRGETQPTATSGVTSAQGTTATTDEKRQTTLTDEEKKEKEDAKAALQQYSGHIDMTSRKPASEAAMREAGWNAVGDQGAYPILETIEDSKGNKHKVLMTPIYADGSVLPRDMYRDFVKSLNGFDDEADLLGRDTHGIIIKMDANDNDVDAIDDLTKKALRGELVKDLDSDLEEEYDPNKSAARNELVEARKTTQKKIDEIMSNPEEPLMSVALKEANDSLKGIEDDIEKTKKRQRTSSLIANIGDILQGFANLAGAWYGANSAQLSSLSAAARTSQERELTKMDKRRDEIMKNIASIKDDLKKKRDTDLSEWIKQLNEINKDIRKFDADAEKAYRAARLKRKEARENTMQQNQRRAFEYAEKKALAKYQSDLRKEENVQKGAIQSGLIAQRANSRNTSNKKKGKGGNRKGKTVDKMK